MRAWQVPVFLLPGPIAVAAGYSPIRCSSGARELVTLAEALGGLLIGGVLALGAGC